MKKFFPPLFAVMLFLISCKGGDESRQGMLPNVGGSTGEVVVVIDKVKWDGELGDKLREVLMAPVEGLPQTEPLFNLINVSPGSFGGLYITHRNVITIRTGEDKAPAATFNSDVYAATQLIINLEGKSDNDIIELLDRQGKLIIDKINIAERDRWISYYKRSINSMNYNTLRNKHLINLYIPSNYALDVNEKGFAWLSYETPTTTQSVMVHYFDHNGENYFNEDSIQSIRDNLTRAKVKGPVAGTWMKIEESVPVTISKFRFRDRDYMEMRGLWTLENGFMGGPFVTLVTRDEVNNRFVMIDGYVYAPRDDKRELIRQVEAILYTVSFDLGAQNAGGQK
jgi:hypothetical protein